MPEEPLALAGTPDVAGSLLGVGRAGPWGRAAKRVAGSGRVRMPPYFPKAKH